MTIPNKLEAPDQTIFPSDIFWDVVDRFIRLIEPLMKYSGPTLKAVILILFLSVPFQLVNEMSYAEYIAQLRATPGNETMSALEARFVFWLDVVAQLFSVQAIEIMGEHLSSALKVTWQVVILILAFLFMWSVLDSEALSRGPKETDDRTTILGLPGERVFALLPPFLLLMVIPWFLLWMTVLVAIGIAYFSMRLEDGWLGQKVDRILGRRDRQTEKTGPDA